MSKSIKIISELTHYDAADELSGTDLMLVEAARASAANAYAPYSEFHVGAALLLDNGEMILGNNQENASYTLGLCAERVAIFAAGANYPGKKILAMAITASSVNFSVNRAIAPCGACRQAIAEYEHRYQQPIRLIMTGATGEVLVADSIRQLLPLQFSKDDLIPESE